MAHGQFFEGVLICIDLLDHPSCMLNDALLELQLYRRSLGLLLEVSGSISRREICNTYIKKESSIESGVVFVGLGLITPFFVEVGSIPRTHQHLGDQFQRIVLGRLGSATTQMLALMLALTSSR